MKKIVVTGALGYIGMELCKIYSGESWYNEIVAIDKRFFSERVNQLTKWNIKFFINKTYGSFSFIKEIIIFIIQFIVENTR